MDEQLAALKDVWQGIEAADKAMMAYLKAGGSGDMAIAAMRHPMKGFQGLIEGKIFDIDPDSLDSLRE